jgi:hypothetical protein
VRILATADEGRARMQAFQQSLRRRCWRKDAALRWNAGG